MAPRFVRSSPMQAALTAVALYALPLLGSPALRAAPPWLGAAAAWLLLVSQPAPARGALWSTRSRDGLSALGILASMIGAQVAAVVEYRLTGGLLRIGTFASLLLGGALVIAGFALRLWSIETLGRFFTATVSVQDEHRVVRTGPYARVRHPSYAGALIIAIGMLVLLHSASGLALLAIAVVPAYVHRVRVEESVLIEMLGDGYVRYRQQVPALVPALRAR